MSVIVVAGDRYPVFATMPAGQGANPKLFSFEGGADLLRDVLVLLCEDQHSVHQCEEVPRDPMLFELRAFEQEKALGSMEKKVVRLVGSWPNVTCSELFKKAYARNGIVGDDRFGTVPPECDVLVHYATDFDGDTDVDTCFPSQTHPKCYIRIADDLDDDPPEEVLRSCTKTIVLIASASGLAKKTRVRLGSSYEAMVVDILRYLKRIRRGSISAAKDRSWFNLGSGKKTIIIIRITATAVLAVEVPQGTSNNDENEVWSPDLYYVAERPVPIEWPGRGQMLGYRTLLGATMVEAFAENAGNYDPAKIQCALENGLRRSSKYFQYGFVLDDIKLWINAFMEVDENNINIVHVSVPFGVAVSPDCYWSILQQTILAQVRLESKRADTRWDCDFYREKAMTVLVSGSTEGLPIARIGELRLVDRDEVQDFLALQAQLVDYAMGQDKRPLCIGVFGPPGSGKSFGIKQIVLELTKAKLPFSREALTYNIAQFAAAHDLEEALHRVRNAGLKGEIPLVFFDEFDTRLENRAFGWLSNFLAPMQDGEFFAGGGTFNLGRCVMVFAGGINRSFSEIDARQRSPEFCEAKGRDFISRLRGCLNVRGVNKPEDETDANRYLIRRAVMLNKMVCDRRKSERGQLVTQMSQELSEAFLGIDTFKHGARSMEAIVRMSRPQAGMPLRPSDLPSREQLDLHVDGHEFTSMYRKGHERL